MHAKLYEDYEDSGCTQVHIARGIKNFIPLGTLTIHTLTTGDTGSQVGLRCLQRLAATCNNHCTPVPVA